MIAFNYVQDGWFLCKLCFRFTSADPLPGHVACAQTLYFEFIGKRGCAVFGESVGDPMLAKVTIRFD